MAQADLLLSRLTTGTIQRTGPHDLVAAGMSAEWIGDVAHHLGVRLHELRAEHASLEQAYLELTEGSAEYGVEAVR